MKRRNFLLGAAGSTFGASLFGSSSFAQAGQVRWGTSQVGSGAQIVLSAIIGVVDNAKPDLKIREQVTSGPVENVRLLRTEQIEIAQTTTADAYNGYFGQRGFSREGPSKGMRGMFCLYPANCTLAVSGASDIRSISDLKGKRIAIGPAGTGIAVVMEQWLNAYGIADSAQLSRVGYRQGADYLKTGAVDAALVYGTGDQPVEYLQELELSMSLRILGWNVTGEEYKKLRETAPEMAAYAPFSKSMVKNLEADVLVPTIYSIEYCNNRLTEEFVYTIMRTVWDNREKIASRANLGSWMGRSAANMLAGLVPEIPVHPGAARFYKEMGVWSDQYKIGEIQP